MHGFVCDLQNAPAIMTGWLLLFCKLLFYCCCFGYLVRISRIAQEPNSIEFFIFLLRRHHENTRDNSRSCTLATINFTRIFDTRGGRKWWQFVIHLTCGHVHRPSLSFRYRILHTAELIDQLVACGFRFAAFLGIDVFPPFSFILSDFTTSEVSPGSLKMFLENWNWSKLCFSKLKTNKSKHTQLNYISMSRRFCAKRVRKSRIEMFSVFPHPNELKIKTNQNT